MIEPVADFIAMHKFGATVVDALDGDQLHLDSSRKVGCQTIGAAGEVAAGASGQPAGQQADRTLVEYKLAGGVGGGEWGLEVVLVGSVQLLAQLLPIRLDQVHV